MDALGHANGVRPDEMGVAVRIAEQASTPAELYDGWIRAINSLGSASFEMASEPERKHTREEIFQAKRAFEIAKEYKSFTDASVWLDAFCRDGFVKNYEPGKVDVTTLDKFEFPMEQGRAYMKMSRGGFQDMLNIGAIRHRPDAGRLDNSMKFWFSSDDSEHRLPFFGDVEFIVMIDEKPADDTVVGVDRIHALYMRDEKGRFVNALESTSPDDDYIHHARASDSISRYPEWWSHIQLEEKDIINGLAKCDKTGQIGRRQLLEQLALENRDHKNGIVSEDGAAVIFKELSAIEGLDIKSVEGIAGIIAKALDAPRSESEIIDDKLSADRMKAFEVACEMNGDPLGWRAKLGDERERGALEPMRGVIQRNTIVDLYLHKISEDREKALSGGIMDTLSLKKAAAESKFTHEANRLMEYAMYLDVADDNVEQRRTMLDQFRLGDFKSYGVNWMKHINERGRLALEFHLAALSTLEPKKITDINDTLGTVNFCRYTGHYLSTMLEKVKPGTAEDGGRSGEEVSRSIGDVSVMVIGKTGDHNGAFAHKTIGLDLTNTLVFEVESKQDISKAVWLLRKGKANIRRLTISGHGDASGIHISKAYTFHNDFDTSRQKTFSEKFKNSTESSPINDLIEDMKPDSEGRKIVNLDSCSQAVVGQKEFDNLPEHLSRIHEKSGVEVHAAVGTAYIEPTGLNEVEVTIGNILTELPELIFWNKRLREKMKEFAFQKARRENTVAVAKGGTQEMPQNNSMEIVA